MWLLDMCYVLGGLHNHLTHSTTTAAHQGSKGRKSQSRFSFALQFSEQMGSVWVDASFNVIQSCTWHTLSKTVFVCLHT